MASKFCEADGVNKSLFRNRMTTHQKANDIINVIEKQPVAVSKPKKITAKSEFAPDIPPKRYP